MDRYYKEFSDIIQNNWGNNFLIAAEVVDWCESNDIMIGPGRGSMACSVTNNLLGITKVNPRRFFFKWQDFMESAQRNLCLSIDVEEGSLERIITYLKEKYGKSNVEKISASTVSIKPERGKKIRLAFVELRILSELKKMEQLITKNGYSFSLESIPLYDEKTLDLFRTAGTDDIFQFETPTMKDFLLNCPPDSFEDLVLMNAIYCPSYVDMIPEFIKAKKNGTLLDFDIPNYNKAHELCYTMISWNEAFIKAHYKKEFEEAIESASSN